MSLAAPEVGDLSPTTTASPVGASAFTTLMVRNIPTRYTASSLLDVLKHHGFADCLDFMYLPMDLRTKKNVGYAFVNFIKPETAKMFLQSFQGVKLNASTSLKSLDIIPSRRQGFINNISVFGGSTDLLKSPSQSTSPFKPLVLVDGGLLPLTDTLYTELLKKQNSRKEEETDQSDD